VLAEFRRHDVLLATSLFEGFGTVVIEAMAAGLPVVAADVGAASDYVRQGRSGYLVPPGNVDAFVAACDRVLALGSAELQALRREAAAAVSDVTWPRVAAATVSAYRAALAQVRHQ
jgi:glycosyltransferase involved in cell wall biosynthesis